jgi:hypothetical protein
VADVGGHDRPFVGGEWAAAVAQGSRVSAPDLQNLCEARLRRIVGDLSVVEPGVDQVGELGGVADVHRVRREQSSLPGEAMCRSSHKTCHRDVEPTRTSDS